MTDVQKEIEQLENGIEAANVFIRGAEERILQLEQQAKKKPTAPPNGTPVEVMDYKDDIWRPCFSDGKFTPLGWLYVTSYFGEETTSPEWRLPRAIPIPHDGSSENPVPDTWVVVRTREYGWSARESNCLRWERKGHGDDIMEFVILPGQD